MGNLNFPKVFVLTAANKWVTNKKPSELTVGQVGLVEIDQFQVSVGGAGATPDPTAKPRLLIAQNVGDNDYGAVRSKVMEITKVKNWFGQAARDAVGQTTYLGYDEADGTKDIVALCGQELVIPIHLYEKKMQRWYAPVGFHKRLVVDTGCCPDCGSPCTAADKTFIAQSIADQINNANQGRVTDFATGNELAAYLTATVVTNGGVGDALRVGVKIVTKAIDNDDQAALNDCDPIKYWEFQTYYFQIGNVFNGFCDGTQLPVTTTVQADPGTGWAAAVAALEAESQGYDRVRDPLTSYPFSGKNNYKIFAVAGTKYDYYHLVYDWTHKTPGATVHAITEPFECIIVCPTGDGGTVEADLNAWLADRFDAVTL